MSSEEKPDATSHHPAVNSNSAKNLNDNVKTFIEAKHKEAS